MFYIKKLVMSGFKSFARKTELQFTKGINVVLGPNGSGKSNITDALCFVLGRLSMKSMRTTKARNLIFLGTKVAPPAKEAIVEIVFDNSNKDFEKDENEVSIKRIVRKNGQSIYKINNETKTRQEVLALLAQAGIDPNGFNIILQGEIQNLVMMQPEERRGIVEEVAGISIYESRKEKTLKELEKTEQKLKEISVILKERNSYLKNLEKEREAALKHKKIEENIKKFKKSIIFIDLSKSKNQKESLIKEIESKKKNAENIKKVIITYQTEIENLEEKISEINSKIQKQTGFEQENLNLEISNLRAKLAGLSVKKENYEKKLKEIERKKLSFHSSMEENEIAIKNLQEESPTLDKIKKELNLKKKELEKLEELRKKYYMDKSELRSLRERIEDKKNLFQNYVSESNFLLQEIKNLSSNLFDLKTDENKVKELKLKLAEKESFLKDVENREREIEKKLTMNNSKIEEHKKIIKKISEFNFCPLCKTKITEEHILSIKDEATPEIEKFEKENKFLNKEMEEILLNKKNFEKERLSLISEIQKRQEDLIKLKIIFDKNVQIKNLQEKIEKIKNEIEKLVKNKESIQNNFDENSNIEEVYETLKMKVEEISLMNKKNLSSEISFKQRELERATISLKQLSREKQDLEKELEIIIKNINEKEKILEIKRKDEEELIKKAKKYIEKRDSLQRKIRETENYLSEKKNSVYNVEQVINNLKIDLAKKEAEVENLETEILEFPEAEIVKLNKNLLLEKLKKNEENFIQIGNVNMRALEVYDEVKKEYDSINEKVEIITKEKESILRIIHEIDVKKKKSFLKTLSELNEIFMRNFSQISTKGQVFLELQNKKEPFNGGIDVIVKTGHGKYFDIKSLSGGEQTMVALSLIFAIQELNPYAFYILDEIDAALDKRNSERLSELLKKYMERGQYIVISHNDETIVGATNLFGVSMHEGVSKIISLKI